MEVDRRLARLAVGTIGAPPSTLIRRIVRRASQVVPIPCRLLMQPMPIQLTRLKGREQVDADRLLHALEAQSSRPAEALCGLTFEDIGHPLFTHFFGRARRDGRAMIVSLARLAPSYYGLASDNDVLVERAVLEIVHELGHLAGLLHCDDHDCIMHFAPTVESIDGRGEWFCEHCHQRFRARLVAAEHQG